MVVKYGAMRIAAVIGAILILGLCGFYYHDATLKENENVIHTILAEGKEFVTSKGVPDYYRVLFIELSEFLNPGSFKEIMQAMPDEEKATTIAAMQLELIWVSTEADPSIRRQSLYYLDSVIQSTPIKVDDPASLMQHLKVTNPLLTPAAFFLHSHTDDRLQNIFDRSLKDITQIVKLSLTQNFNAKTLDIAQINTGLEYALHYRTLTPEDNQQILAHVSPFEGSEGRSHFFDYFPAGKFILYSTIDEINHSAGYQQLAYLYASLGDVPKVKMCVDSLFKFHSSYSIFYNNIFNIANYFVTYKHEKELGPLIECTATVRKSLNRNSMNDGLALPGCSAMNFFFQKWWGPTIIPTWSYQYNHDSKDIQTLS